MCRGAALLLVVLSACTSEPAGPLLLAGGESVTVKDVIKGDELEVSRDGNSATVRLLGIHTLGAVKFDPTLEAMGNQTRAHVAALLLGKTVTLTLGTPPKDEYGRYLAYLTKDGADQNRTLIADGWAVVYTEYGFDREADYLAAEKTARGARRGLWAEDAAVELIGSLRGLWAQRRQQRDGKTVEDAWLSERASAAAPSPAAAGAPAAGASSVNDTNEPALP